MTDYAKLAETVRVVWVVVEGPYDGYPVAVYDNKEAAEKACAERNPAEIRPGANSWWVEGFEVKS